MRPPAGRPEGALYQQLPAAEAQAFERDPLFRAHAAFAFRREEEIGEGGMGAVYRVTDLRARREAALKVLRHAELDERRRRRFIREARVTALLDHPAIPPVYEYGRAPGGEHYILMKLVRGQTLAEHLARFHERDSDRDLALILRALLRVCEALGYAHSRGVIHRDVKPGNIMIGEEHGEVYLMDWGLARDLRESVEDDADLRQPLSESVFSDKVSVAGRALGTFGYMPPEQAVSAEVDGRADLYALGAILCELMTGEAPIRGRGINAVVAAVEGVVVFPKALEDRFGSELVELARACLEPEPQRRPPGADQVAARLRAALTPSRRPRRALPPTLTLTLGLALFAALIGLALLVRDRRAREAALAESQRRAEDSGRQAAELRRQYRGLSAVLERTRQRLGRFETEPAAGPAVSPEVRADDLLVRARTAILEERWSEAIAAATRALQVSESAEALRLRGDARIQLNEIDRALADFDRALAIDPEPFRSLIKRGRVYLALERFEEALRDFSDALALEPLDPRALNNRGAALMELRRYEQALEDFNKADRLSPDDPDILDNRGCAYHALERYPQALADFQRVLELSPDRGGALENRAAAYLDMGEDAKAIADFRRVIRLEPKNPRPHNLLGVIYGRRGESEEALAEYDQAIAKNPKYELAYNNRGNIFHARGEYRRAIADYERALRLDPDYLDAYNNRAFARLELGDKAGATRDFQRCLALAIKSRRSEDARDAREELARLGAPEK